NSLIGLFLRKLSLYKLSFRRSVPGHTLARDCGRGMTQRVSTTPEFPGCSRCCGEDGIGIATARKVKAHSGFCGGEDFSLRLTKFIRSRHTIGVFFGCFHRPAPALVQKKMPNSTHASAIVKSPLSVGEEILCVQKVQHRPQVGAGQPLR